MVEARRRLLLVCALAVLAGGVGAAVVWRDSADITAIGAGGVSALADERRPDVGAGGAGADDVAAAGPKADDELRLERPATTVAPPPTIPPTTAAPTTAATVAPTTPPAAPAAAAATPYIVPPGQFTMAPYAGLGAWLDVYDWSATYTGGNPQIGMADIDAMAANGVRTIYIQASKWDSPTPVLEPERLVPLITRAHELGMHVVVWYLPTLEYPESDLYRLVSIAALGVDGIAVDIEGRNVGDVAERNRRLVQLSADLRAHLPGQVISAVPVPPVVMENINPNFWPGFPWAELAPYYDVWQPMSYWSDRRPASGWRDGYAYTAANIDRIRALIGRPDAPVHSIGGIGDRVSVEQIAAMVQASYERGAIGGSIYDYRTTGPEHWETLRLFNG